MCGSRAVRLERRLGLVVGALDDEHHFQPLGRIVECAQAKPGAAGRRAPRAIAGRAPCRSAIAVRSDATGCAGSGKGCVSCHSATVRSTTTHRNGTAMMARSAINVVSGASATPRHRIISAAASTRRCQAHRPVAAESSGLRDRKPKTASSSRRALSATVSMAGAMPPLTPADMPRCCAVEILGTLALPPAGRRSSCHSVGFHHSGRDSACPLRGFDRQCLQTDLRPRHFHPSCAS